MSSVLPPRPGYCYLTMSVGQWDTMLHAGYDSGWILLELDDDERILRAYRRPEPTEN
jgi:hypothetical protein